MVASACAPNPPSRDDGSLKIGCAVILVVLDPDVATPRPEVMEWVRRAAVAVSGYLGYFPVKHLTVSIHGGGDEPIGGGVTHGDGHIDVRLSASATSADLKGDWIMTHEMFHLAFPTLDRRYLWMMEGLSDYLEPIARARAGQWSAADAWREFAEGLPQGLPRPQDLGLDHTHTRESIYWGGNLYWLLTDVRIRVATDNHHSVDDAIRAILAAGGNGAADWSLAQVFAVGDPATGTTFLQSVYNEMGPQAAEVDLVELWNKLGVKYRFGKVTVDDSAPWAAIRESITSPTSAVSRLPARSP